MRSLAATSLLISTLAIAQTTKVIPPAAASRDLPAYTDTPFLSDSLRFQHLVSGGAVTAGAAVIREISYRIDKDVGSGQTGWALPRIDLILGHSGATPATMRPTFAANRSGPQSVLFSARYVLPNQPVITGPGPWNIRFALTRPFVYVRASGDLLIEMVVPGTFSQLRWYPLDAAGGSTGGTAQRFGAAGRFASNDPYEASALATYLLYPGGRATLGVDGCLRQYPAVAAFGLSRTRFGAVPLPLDLTAAGAPGNWLHVSMDVLLPLPLAQDAKSKWNGSAWLPIPNVAFPAGTRVYAQAVFGDAGSNHLGAVLSNGVEMQLDPKPGAASNAYGATDHTATNGVQAIRWGGPIGGPVIQLTGVGFN